MTAPLITAPAVSTTHRHDPPRAPSALMTAARHAAAPTLAAFVEGATTNGDLWQSTLRRAALDADAVARAARLTEPRHLHVLLADWCTDAIGTIPWVQRLVDAMPAADLRCVDRDQHLDLMDAHLTGTARAIPVVLVYDAAFRELAWWGPRPAALHGWALHDAPALEKDERNKFKRSWYARDRGASTVAELLALLEAIA